MNEGSIYQLVSLIPAGSVMTYGQLAALVGKPHGARYAARAMAAAPGELPCHRVINAKGELAPEHIFGQGVQRQLLLAEGVHFLPDGRVDLRRCRFLPGAADRI